ncbi:MAG: M20/M25/M40 family metallo-hydrolase [Chloroflexi bacterium]|nr:M20/M25/M40 family metallo-hydrolase [Chloroflexota bacterium]
MKKEAITLSPTERKVLDRIRGSEVAELALELGRRRSPDGHEAEVGQFILGWLQANGFRTTSQEVAAKRYNAIGVLSGSGDGLSLLYNSHMDTAFQFGDDDLWRHRETNPIYYNSWIDGERVYGRDVINDKGPMACFMMAAKAIRDSGLQLPGDLILTMVVGEMCFTPVDEFQGPRYAGIGAGSYYLVNHGITADYGINAEQTGYIPTWVECGDARFKITVLGKLLYTPMIYHPAQPEENPSAVIRMTPVIQALTQWAREFENQHRYEFSLAGYSGVSGGKVNISAIRGGLPYFNVHSPGVCSLYIHIYFPPDLTTDQVREELETFLHGVGVTTEVEMYASAPGAIGKGVEPLLKSIDKAHGKVFGSNLPPRGMPQPLSSMWRDVSCFNQAGIPTVSYGPPTRTYDAYANYGKEEFFTFEEMETTASLYALIAMDICSRKRTPRQHAPLGR